MAPPPVPQSKPPSRQGSGANVFAAFISLFIPGAGQFCQGRVLPGVGFLLAAFFFGSVWTEKREPLGIVLLIACAIASCVNAGRWNPPR